MEEFVTITKNDVNKSIIKAFGHPWPVSSFIGNIQPQDIGKRIYLINGTLKVENNQQLKERTKTETRS